MLTINQRERNPTQRERVILTLLAEGHSQIQIAEVLSITPHAIARTLENLRNHFAPTNCSLIALAVRLEWITFSVEIRQDDRQRKERLQQKKKADRD